MSIFFSQIRKIAISTWFVFLIVFSVTSIVRADYTVSPVMIDYTLEARDTVSREITITNSSDRLKRVYATVNAINIDSDGEIVPYEPPSTQNRHTNPTSWVAITRGRVELPAQDTYTVPLSLSIPAQVEPGTYHLYIGFSEGRNRPTAEEAIWSSLPPGVIVRIEIVQNEPSYLTLSGVTVDRLIYTNDSLLEFSLKNPGSTAQIPFGEIIFYDRRGNEVWSTPVNPDGISVGSGEEKFFYAPLPDASFGRYRAVLNVRYGQGQVANLQDTLFYTKLPIMQMILLFFFLLLLTIAVSYLIHRRYNTSIAYSYTSEGPIYVHNRSGEISFKKVHDINLK